MIGPPTSSAPDSSEVALWETSGANTSTGSESEPGMLPSVPLASVPLALSREDVARAKDRLRVHHARWHKKRWKLIWLLVGPGILAMLGENDGPSMIAYASDGAQYGLGLFLPFIPALFAMAYVCQETCMRVGAITHRGFGELVLQRYGKVWGWFGAIDLTVTNLVTLVAEFVSIRVGLAYFHLGAGVAVALGLALVAFSLSGHRYWRWERIVLGVALFNGLFLVAAVLASPHFGGVAHSPVAPIANGGVNTLLLLVASTVGATVTPWMIFFQQSATADKGMTSLDLRHGRYDTAMGALVAAIFGLGALVAGAVLFVHHTNGIEGFAGAGYPEALRHVAGGAAGAVFALGLMEAGAVAVLTISASTAYAAGECVGAPHSFNSSPRTAALFYAANGGVAAIAASVILIPGAPLLAIALNANVLATVLLPVTLVLMVMLANDRELMGSWANARAANVRAFGVIATVALCGLAYGLDEFLRSTHLVGS